MKKIFSFALGALMSVAMWAGENDRLWDYTEGAPSKNPDHGLYYASKVTDGPGVKNGLYGIKMNGSGYAYFTKPAVAGKLKLGFGPRSGSNAEKMVIQTWTGDTASATVPTGLVTIATTGAQSEYGFQTVDLTAEQNNIYIKREGTVESVLQYLSFKEGGEDEPDSCVITFKDQTGKVIGKIGTVEGATLEAIPYGVEDLTPYSKSEVFRGWFYTNNKKAKIGDPINGNTTIQAHVTLYERATEGSVQTYDFADQTFYPEDHETVEVTGGAFHDGQHGWYFAADGSIKVDVAGNAVVVVTLCKYSESGDVKVMAGETELAKYEVVKNTTPDGTELTAQYTGNGGELTINWTAKQYIHKVVVYNVKDFIKKDEKTGYIIVPANDVASFILALVQAQEGDKIFLPNGTYDLGETCLTTISKNNIAIIGESMDLTVIKNAPDAAKESIDKTATLKINKNVTGTYLQDLTIQNALDYYKNNNGRAVCLWDQGTQTVCKNVKLLSYQDTYYSNLVGAVKYFETSEIHGTVDFICGDGSVYFYGTELVCEQRNKNGGGADAVTASNADANDKGYVFDFCTLKYAEDIQGTLPVVSFGRSWNNAPKCVFLNTFLDNSNGELNMYKEANAQKDKIARWHLGAMNALPAKFGEYNSVNAAGQNITPESNNVTFVLNSSEKQMETILSASEAATYTMAYTLGDWASTAKADAQQEECDLQNIDLEGIYLVVNDTAAPVAVLFTGAQLKEVELKEGAIVRKANARGGFGEPAEDGGETGIEIVESQKSKVESIKVIRDGQLFIIRDGKIYTAQGMEVKE